MATQGARSRLLRWVALAATVGVSSAQTKQQVASWVYPRGAVVRDVVVVGDGDFWIRNVSSDGTLTDPESYTPQGGLLFNINLCQSFHTTGDTLHLLNQTPYNQDSAYPRYIGGAVFANDYEFYAYGGIASKQVPNGTIDIYHGGEYQPNPDIKYWQGTSTNWGENETPAIDANITHVAMGGWTSAPSENLGFWFGGLQNPNGGSLNWRSTANSSDQANMPSRSFIEVDMSNFAHATFKNLTWPQWLEPRAEGALVWLPYSKRGILLAIGGIQVPSDLQIPGIVPAETYKNDFMTNIAVYDIDSGEWALQGTRGSSVPRTQLAGFCTTVATAQDNSSYFIYTYGGYDGTYSTTQTSTAYDEVWVLTVPEFHWTQINTGTSDHARQSHICVSPNPSQMLSIGGSTDYGNPLKKGDWLDVFDLNAEQWTHQYNPNNSDPYNVSPKIIAEIGGSRTGGFKVPSSGLNSSVATWLNTNYPNKSKILGYAPHNRCAGTSPTVTPGPSGKKTPSWQTPVIAVLAVLVGLAIIATVVWLCCFRKRKSRSSEATASRRRTILSWRRGVEPPAPKSESTDDTAIAPPVDYFAVKAPETEAYEMPSTATPSSPFFAHGHAQLVSPMSPSSEVDVNSRHEMADSSVGARESISIRNHPMYPRSLPGEHIRSAHSGSISHPPEQALAPHPFELPHNRSNENLPPQTSNDVPPTSTIHEEVEASTSQAQKGGEVQGLDSAIGTAMVARKPLTSPRTVSTPDQPPTDRPAHQRNNSSMSSGLPNLPSPLPEEDKRMSRQIDALPDIERQVSSPTGGRKTTGRLRSAYHENFDEEDSLGTWNSNTK